MRKGLLVGLLNYAAGEAAAAWRIERRMDQGVVVDARNESDRFSFLEEKRTVIVGLPSIGVACKSSADTRCDGERDAAMVFNITASDEDDTKGAVLINNVPVLRPQQLDPLSSEDILAPLVAMPADKEEMPFDSWVKDVSQSSLETSGLSVSYMMYTYNVTEAEVEDLDESPDNDKESDEYGALVFTVNCVSKQLSGDDPSGDLEDEEIEHLVACEQQVLRIIYSYNSNTTEILRLELPVRPETPLRDRLTSLYITHSKNRVCQHQMLPCRAGDTTAPETPDDGDDNSDPDSSSPISGGLGHSASYPMRLFFRVLLITGLSALLAVIIGGTTYAFLRWWYSRYGASPLERGWRRREDVRRFEMERLLTRPHRRSDSGSSTASSTAAITTHEPFRDDEDEDEGFVDDDHDDDAASGLGGDIDLAKDHGFPSTGLGSRNSSTTTTSSNTTRPSAMARGSSGNISGSSGGGVTARSRTNIHVRFVDDDDEDVDDDEDDEARARTQQQRTDKALPPKPLPPKPLPPLPPP